MNRPAFSFCICPDSHLLRLRLNTLLTTHPPPEGKNTFQNPPDLWQRFTFWADEGFTPSFWEHLALQGLFAVPKALILRNAQSLPVESLRLLSAALEPLAGKTLSMLKAPLLWPLLCLEVSFDRGAPKLPASIQKLPCYLLAKERGWIEIIPGLSSRNLPFFVKAEASRMGLVLSQHDTVAIAEALPPDAALISSELAKLALLADAKGHLQEKALEAIVQTQELNIFELMHIVQQNRNAPVAWKRILEDRLSGENMVFAFIAILLREARLLWQSLAGSSEKISLPAHVLTQKKDTAQILKAAGIARLWDIALTAEKGIKSGERSPDQAFEIMAADLFLLFGGTGQR